jgi:hypothetical protein
MSAPLSDEMLHWLEWLATRPVKNGGAGPHVPGVIRILLINKKLACLRNGAIEITLDGMDVLHMRM